MNVFTYPGLLRTPQGVRLISCGLSALVWLSTPSHVKAEPSTADPKVAYDANEINTARSLGMGGAVRGVSSSYDALWFNASNIVSARQYHIGGVMNFWFDGQRQTYAGAITDSGTSSTGIGGGASFAYTFQDTDGVKLEWMDVRGAAAYQISEYVYVGGVLHYLALTENGSPYQTIEPSQASGGLANQQIINQFTFDASVTFRPIPEVRIALVGNNLTAPSTAFMPLNVGGGIGYAQREFSLGVDGIVDFRTETNTTWKIMAGGEYLAGDKVPLRLGYRYDSYRDANSVSGSIGYLDKDYSVEAGFRGYITPVSEQVLSLTFKYHIDTVADF